MVITMAKLHMSHASTHGARKPPGPKKREKRDWKLVIFNSGQLRIATPPRVAHEKSPGPKTINNLLSFFGQTQSKKA